MFSFFKRDYTQRLITLMYYKQSCIDLAVYNYNHPLMSNMILPKYFTYDDYKDLKNFSQKESKQIVKDMIFFLELTKSASISSYLNSEMCPYCAKYNNKWGFTCNDCTYGLNHYLCNNSESDYSKISNFVHGGGNIYIKNAFDKDVLIRILKGKDITLVKNYVEPEPLWPENVYED